MADSIPTDPEELAAKVDALSRRVEALEQELASSRSERGLPAEPVEVPPVVSPPLGPAPERRAAHPDGEAAAGTLYRGSPEAKVEPKPEAVDPLDGETAGTAEPRALRIAGHAIERENMPVIAMAVAGGCALLLGLLYFTWYSIQRGWISPAVRVSAVAILGAVALLQGWRLATRGQRSVGQALAGAGVGGWFGAILVGRHVHDFFGPTLTFVLLAAGAAGALAAASHQGLRFLAFLAAWGAFLTPFMVGSEEDRFHEVMTYQLIVAVALSWLESRRRWGELGFFALVSTWILYHSRPFSGELGHPDLPMFEWGFALLGLGYVQVAPLLRQGRAWRVAGTARTVWLLLSSWAGILMASNQDNDVAGYGTLALALANGVFAVIAFRAVRARVGDGPLRFATCVLAGGAAWVQLCVAAPLLFEGERITMAWFVLTGLAAGVHFRVQRGPSVIPIALPYLLAFGRALEGETGVEIRLGYALALLPIALGLGVSRRARVERDGGYRVLLSLCLALGALTWHGMLESHLTLEPESGWLLALLLVPAVVAAPLLLFQRGVHRAATLLFGLGILVARVLVLSAQEELLSPLTPLGVLHLWHGAVLAGIALVAWWLGRGFQRIDPAAPELQVVPSPELDTLVDASGLLVTAALGVLGLHLVSGTLPSLTSDPDNAASLNQAGWSVVGALAGLGLLLRGLFERRGAWRRSGIVLLFLVAGKLVVIDMIEVSMVWRVLSFMGLGLCFLAGAYAYRRLQSRIDSAP